MEEAREHLQEIIEVGPIRNSESQYSSYVVIVLKKDGSICFCVVLRKLNNHIVKGAFAISTTSPSKNKIFLEIGPQFWLLAS